MSVWSWKTGIVLAVVVVGVVALLLLPIVRTHQTVWKLIERPKAEFDTSEWRRIYRYVWRDNWWQRKERAIPAKVQEGLVDALVVRYLHYARTSSGNVDGLANVMIQEWERNDGMFESLPAALGDAAGRGEPGVGPLLMTAAGERDVSWERYMDPEAVLASNNAMLLLGAFDAFDMTTLRRHRRSCRAFLAKAKVDVVDGRFLSAAKHILLLRIAESGQGATWFGDRPKLWAEVRAEFEEEAPDTIGQIEAQIQAVEESSESGS